MSPVMAQRDRRAVTLGVVVLAVAGAYVYALRPFNAALAARRAAVAEQGQLLARERALIAVTPELPKAIADARTAADGALAPLLRSEATATATVRLADYVRDLARTREVLVTQTTELPADSLPGGIHVARLSLRGEGDYAGVMRFLRALESGKTTVRVRDVQIERSSALPRGVSGGTAGTDQIEVLTLSAVVESPVVIAPSGGSSR
jgi:hypothetical protein